VKFGTPRDGAEERRGGPASLQAPASSQPPVPAPRSRAWAGRRLVPIRPHPPDGRRACRSAAL